MATPPITGRRLRCSIEEWVTSVGVTDQQSPLFFEIRKTGRGAEARYVARRSTGITTDGIWYIVRCRVREAGITPHSLRHVLITLALAGGAPLHKVQYAAGHADPRTTERYDRRRDDLDDNAVDHVKL
jgi:site-specific recombinase XerD